jgi:hypothetical protein
MQFKKTHGQSHSTEYVSWRDMKRRCLNPTHKDYASYGGGGITVCERWLKFENFFADMGLKPAPRGYTIERKDAAGNYEPSNCLWVHKSQQSKNRRCNFTPEEDQKIREAIAMGFTFRQMAEYVGKERGPVMTRTYRLGLKCGSRQRRSDIGTTRRNVA